MPGIALVYAGFLASLLGIVSLVRPLALLGIHTRFRGAIVLAIGLFVTAAGFLWPAGEVKIDQPRAQLDAFLPVYQFHEVHSADVNAPCDRAYQAVRDVRANEIFLFRTLTWIRRLGRSGAESILNPRPDSPILDVATRTSFLMLAEEPGREVVLGTLVAAPPGWHPTQKPSPEGFRSLRTPGFALAAMNFRLEAKRGGRCLVTTETRVYATDASTRRRFARYWRVIYPGSALIRRMWLRAVKKRAEERLG